MQNPAPFSHTEVDFALKTLREEFLCLSMSGAVRAIPDEPATSSSTQSEHQRVSIFLKQKLEGKSPLTSQILV